MLAAEHDGGTAFIAVTAGQLTAVDVDYDDGEKEPVERTLARSLIPPTEAAVGHALRMRARRRLGALFTVESRRLELRRRVEGLSPLSDAPRVPSLLLAALKDRAHLLNGHQVRSRLAGRRLRLTELGRELVADARLTPRERAMIAALEGPDGVEVDASLRHNELRFLYALSAAHACQTPAPRDGYALLLRKVRQVRRAAHASELLEVPQGSDGIAARRALRRLARNVHPDRFGSASPAIVEASTQVMSALAKAQKEF